MHGAMWDDADFLALRDEDKLVALYCVTGAQANRLGVFRFSPARAAEDLRLEPAAFVERFDRVREQLAWRFDAENACCSCRNGGSGHSFPGARPDFPGICP